MERGCRFPTEPSGKSNGTCPLSCAGSPIGAFGPGGAKSKATDQRTAWLYVVLPRLARAASRTSMSERADHSRVGQVNERLRSGARDVCLGRSSSTRWTALVALAWPGQAVV